MIVLARCEDFNIGPVKVRPSTCELAGPERLVGVEPKVMQLLVVLSRHSGRVVARDMMITDCWDGRAVGEDAVNRVVGKLRRALLASAGSAIRIDTVSRVGLRLLVDGSAGVAPAPAEPAVSETAPDVPRASRALSGTRGWLAATALAVASVAAVLGTRHRPPPQLARPAEQLPPAVRDLETRGLSAMFDNTSERTAEGITYLRQATATAPQSASIWGSLAMSYVLALGWTPPAAQPATVARVRDAAAHAQARDPRESRAAAALVSLTPTFRHWDEKAAALRYWHARVHPDNGPLRYQEVQFLLATGRTSEALGLIQPLARASPLIPWIQAAHIDLLAASGRLADADRAAASALAIWPRDPLIWFTCFDLAAQHGQPGRALAMAADRGTWPRDTAAQDIMLAARTVRAIPNHNAAATTALLASYRTRGLLGQGHMERAMRAAAALGRLDAAMAFAQQLLFARDLGAEPRGRMLPHIGLASDDERPTAALFLPPADRLWQQSGFKPLMASTGLVDYWRRAAPPDLCASNRSGLTAQC